MNSDRLLLQSVALRLLESLGTTAWWVVAVPEGTERAAANELEHEIRLQGGSVSVGPTHISDAKPDITLLVVTHGAAEFLPALLDSLRSRLAEHRVLAFIVSESRAGHFLHQAPHVASFVGSRLVFTAVEDDDAPAHYASRRLESLRRQYGMTDDQARAAFEAAQKADDIHLLEWMLLLGETLTPGPES
ncbi:MAG: hypothetical protein AAGF11_32920 [Myxococcota bacterium]